jgi:hypothetical protein
VANFPFRNVSKVGQPLISDNIEANLAAYLQWNLLGTCAFSNVNYNTSGSYGGLASKLRLAKHSNYTNGQVWEGFRKQWIWQSGIDASVQPINISGVKVNGTFHPTSGVGAFAHTIDYPNGRIIFNSAISQSATVLVEYSYNYYQVYTADNPWWSQFQRNSFRVDDSAFLTSASGVWNKPPEQRVQLPALIVEATPNMHKTPYNIGSHMHWHKQEVKIHVVTETRQDLKWATDVITGQYDGVINMFDKAQMIVSGVYPINLTDGSLSSSLRNYPDILNNYPLRRELQMKDYRSFDNNQYLIDILEKRTIPFYYTTIRFQAETLLS